MEKIYKCPKCGEKENLHLNYDYGKQHRPVESVLCNECGEIFDGDMPVPQLENYTLVAGQQLSISDVAQQPNSFILSLENKPIIVIDEVGFKYKGELIEDAGEVYRLFKEFLKMPR